MLIVTTTDVPGHDIVEVIGVVYGAAIRTGTQEWVRAKLGKEPEEVAEDIRLRAIIRLRTNAKETGANAVVRMRFQTTMLNDFTVEVLAYGTGVIVKKRKSDLDDGAL